MSQENLEVVQASNEAWNRGDMDALNELYDPRAMIVTALDGWPEPAPIVGRDAVMRQFLHQREVWKADTVNPVGDPIAFGDRVVVRTTWHGVGHDPDMDMEMTVAYTVRNGRIFLLEFFWDHVDALEAIGLSGPTSRANLEVVRAMLEAVGPDIDRNLWIDQFCHPEIEWHDTPTFPSAGVYRGREAFARHAADFEEAWADWGIEIEDIRPAGDRVVARIRYRGVGKLSGAPITGGTGSPATGAVFELREGRVTRVLQFVNHAEALEAAGLSV